MSPLSVMSFLPKSNSSRLTKPKLFARSTPPITPALFPEYLNTVRLGSLARAIDTSLVPSDPIAFSERSIIVKWDNSVRVVQSACTSLISHIEFPPMCSTCSSVIFPIKLGRWTFFSRQRSLFERLRTFRFLSFEIALKNELLDLSMVSIRVACIFWQNKKLVKVFAKLSFSKLSSFSNEVLKPTALFNPM
ncbi:hypothetical protein BpHYR1_045678 [Brachionus plicatilis]|uniref:Uncharacterized protein n=1 Tax=Brachionus plicatilis TaxID=10195 RepID=A0A3M7QFW2_BRAPC|nr:hypothetical protein BpHYR1_045678 [Brachionus plicatilis]